MHVENVRSTIEELEREYKILSDKLNDHEKQKDGIDRIINNLDRELKSKQKELEQLKVCCVYHSYHNLNDTLHFSEFR